MGYKRRTTQKSKTTTSGSYPLRPDSEANRPELVKRPPIKFSYDLSMVPDRELLEEMRKRGVTKITY
jgi:hypothetical protein